MDGVVCGHIHKPRLTRRDGFVYCNDGDWVEHCSALVERLDGTLSLIHWTEQAYSFADGGDCQGAGGGDLPVATDVACDAAGRERNGVSSAAQLRGTSD